jgi:four helix bundle protein
MVSKFMQDFKKLSVWGKSHLLTVAVYTVSSGFPPKEAFGLTSQLRRASASISANIAEGCGRGGKAELMRFLTIAFGSASEVEYHLLLAKDLLYLKPDDYEKLNEQVTQVKRMLTALMKKIKA